MENYFKFFDDLSIEDTQYWHLKGGPSKGETCPSDQTLGSVIGPLPEVIIELLWQRSKTPLSWSFRVQGALEWTPSSAAHLEDRLLALGVSKDHFQNEMTASIMTHIAHAQMVFDAGHRLLGPAVVHEATRQTQDFLSSLQMITETLLSTNPDETAPKNSKKPVGKGHLRLVGAEFSPQVHALDLDLDIDLAWEFDIP